MVELKLRKRRWALLAPYLKRFRWKIVPGLVLVATSTALDQVSPWMVKLIIDGLSAGKGMGYQIWPILGIVVATLVASVMLYFQRLWVIQSSREIEYQVRKDLFSRLLAQPKAFFDRHAIGHIMSLATNDLERVRDMVGPAILHLGRMACLLVYTAGCLFFLSPKLALVGLVPALLMPFLANTFLKRMYHLFGGIQKNLSSLNSFVQDTLTGIHVVKGFGKQQAFHDKFTRASRDLRDSSFKVAVYNASIWPAIGVLGALGILLVIWVGARMVIQQEISLGDLSAGLLFLLRLQFPLVGLGWVASMIQRANVSLDRLDELQQQFTRPEKERSLIGGVLVSAIDNENSIQRSALGAEGFRKLETRGLDFRYEVKGPLVLRSIDVDMRPGKWLGIVGPIGSGKTTLMQILAGIYSPPPGQLFLDGKPREEFSDPHWRRYFAYVPQDGFLFSTSIRKNIEMGATGTPPTVEQAGDWAAFSKDLPQIPGGYEALLGERGINLSGGQKQRVGLARALMSDAPILCLDDTLSALDPETETQILAHLREQFAHCTVILISHRYSAVRECDEILYLEAGEIAERGRHDSLLAHGGAYAQVWEKQKLSMSLEAE